MIIIIYYRNHDKHDDHDESPTCAEGRVDNFPPWRQALAAALAGGRPEEKDDQHNHVPGLFLK